MEEPTGTCRNLENFCRKLQEYLGNLEETAGNTRNLQKPVEMWRNMETDLVPALGLLMFEEQVAQISQHQLALFQANDGAQSVD